MRAAIGTLGRALIGSGLVLLLFVAYQLWGTGFQESRSQDRLSADFEALLHAPSRPNPAPPPPGGAVAMLKIPRIGLQKAVVEGAGVGDLKKGPGHYPTTPMPGQKGNAAIAGHRTTYGAPFLRLDELTRGDAILVTTAQGAFRYEVRDTAIVSPDQNEVLLDTDDDRLTLTTCNPRFSARERMIVTASLAGKAFPAVRREREDSLTLADISGDTTARGPALGWAITVVAVGLVTRIVAHYWRPLPAYLIGLPVLLVTLFVFFENVARVLPANV